MPTGGRAPDRRMAGARDGGAGTVLVIAVIALAGLLITVTLVTGRAVQARHRAQGAADLAALAAAAVVEEGEAGPAGSPCAAAAGVATANQAAVTACVPHAGGDVSVTVEVDFSRFSLMAFPSSNGKARAGPLP